jgi:L-ribulose-5-phosphate 3-epimerase
MMHCHWQSNLAAIPLGLYEKALPASWSWSDRLRRAADAGYDFMEMSVDDSDERIERLFWSPVHRAELRTDVEQTGLPIKSMSLSAHRRYALGSKSDKIRQIGLDLLHRAIDFSAEFGLRYLLIAGADVYHEPSTDISRERFLLALEQGFEWASAAGVMLALENWDIGVNSLHKAMLYVNHFSSPWFQLYADIGNLAYAGCDILKELEGAKGHIAALHIKDTLRGQVRYVPLGDGCVPFSAAFKKLAETGFQGPAVVELWTESYPNAMQLVSDANQWVRERMREGWQTALADEPYSQGDLS